MNWILKNSEGTSLDSDQEQSVKALLMEITLLIFSEADKMIMEELHSLYQKVKVLSRYFYY
jgi:hypothetical protein